jgi:amino acid adenylation domain-containing protein
VTDARDLWGLFAETAARAPDAVALSDGEERLTYGQALAEGRHVAAALRDAGVRPGARVALLLGRGAGAVVAMLGVLAAGAAYVPIDPDYPPERVRVLLEDSEPDAVIAASADAAGEGRLDLARARARACDDDVAPEPPPGGADAAAYVIFTSGSSGRPKGVVVTHGNVLALLRGALPLFDVGANDVWTQFHSTSFDFSVWELWGAFATGARVVCVGREAALDPRRLLALLHEERVTVLSQVPSAFRRLVTAHAAVQAPALALRYVVFGGEAVDLPSVDTFLARARARGEEPQCINMYGITETTVHATFKRIDARVAAGRGSPIGTPLPHLTIALVDAEGDPVPPGSEGEMWIAGDGVAAGYLGRPDLTAERFVARTVAGVDGRWYRSGDLAVRSPDGELEYRGRNDEQVKLRGSCATRR